MAISEILSAVEELGGLVKISCYEVCQDRVYDLLEPKEQEVLVMEDATRRIQLKGLSQVCRENRWNFWNMKYLQICLLILFAVFVVHYQVNCRSQEIFSWA